MATARKGPLLLTFKWPQILENVATVVDTWFAHHSAQRTFQKMGFWWASISRKEPRHGEASFYYGLESFQRERNSDRLTFEISGKLTLPEFPQFHDG